MGFFRKDSGGVAAPVAEPTLPMPSVETPTAMPQPMLWRLHSYVPPFVHAPPGPQAGLPAGVAGDPGHPPPPQSSLPPQGPPPRASKAARWLKALVIGTTAAAAAFAGMMIYFTAVMPDPMSLRQKERAPVIRILASDGSVLAERGAAHDFMPLDLLPKHVIDAVVATEDRRFYEHWGLDPAGLARAFFANLRAGRFVQGGSTLTQQLAKNLFLTSDRTLGRKLEELLLAVWLELRLGKSDILELYLNRVYFGGGAYGIEAAAQRYFEKSARELTLAEAAVIAGLLKAPSKFAPSASPGAARARGRSVVQKMRAADLIGQAEERRALVERVRFAETKPQKEQSGIEYAVDFVLERMPPLVGAGHAEIVVETTLDAGLQRRAHAIVARKLAEQGETLQASQAALIVLDPDGGIRAMIGGRSYAESQFNRAVKARRQPGSAFKPFVFLAALESGMTPDSIGYDLPLSIEGWTPRNTNGRYQGAMPLRRALAESVNTIAARLQMDVGAGRIAEVAARLGVKSELRQDPSMALGTSEVALAELVGSYGVLANGGAAIVPHAIRRVRMSSGRVLYARRATRTEQVVAPAHVGAMNDMLNAALVQGTGRRAALAHHPAAGKTGTTTDFRDAVFVGYTAHFVAGVWVGNDTGKPMNRVMGGGLPAEIWREVMVAAHAGRAPLTLPGTGRLQAGPVADGSPAGAQPAPLPPREPPAAPGVAPSRAPAVAQSRPSAGAIPLSVAQQHLTRPDIDTRHAPVAQRLLVTAPAAPSAPAARPVTTSRPAEVRPAEPQASTEPWRRPKPAYPKDRIEEDFIARAVGDTPDAPPSGTVAGLPSGFDVEEIRKRLQRGPEAIVQGQPPHGMMTLGAGAR